MTRTLPSALIPSRHGLPAADRNFPEGSFESVLPLLVGKQAADRLPGPAEASSPPFILKPDLVFPAPARRRGRGQRAW